MYQIMIIEDDLVIQEELSVLLKSNGYEVMLIKDFLNSISEIKKYNPHLLLLDINLPVYDGFKICSRISW